MAGVLAFLCAACLIFPTPAKALSAQSALLMEVQSGQVLFAQNEDERLPMASTTKIMTALVAVEQGDPRQLCVVSKRAAGTEGSSLYLKAGEVYTLEQLLYGLLLRSGNDAAAVIAESVGGSEENFVQLMNETARRIGLNNTHFDNPSGLDGDTHYTTARELALLTAYALQNEEFCRYFGAKQYVIEQAPTHEGRTLVNKHRLLTSRQDVIGGKTGYTKASGRCLVTAAHSGGMTLVAVTINDPDDWADHEELLDWGFESHECVELSEKIPVQRVPVAGGGSLEVRAAQPSFVVLPRGEGQKLQVVCALPRFCYAGVGLLEPVGEASVTLRGEELARLPLVCWQKDIPSSGKRGIWELITDAICTILK
ncbi:MAG TPA: D-alanyl-D-alanine carboxypeptidase [Candidatus Galloscillospira excrementipullorum]|nr:D-alanyl-D-alanine carboxypeptidase [Candidatus Galloscillospira excrementipullorum]